MAAWRRITIMQNLYNRTEGELRCEKCGHVLDVGDRAWAHMCPRKRSSYTEYFCLMCFSKLWLQ